MQKNKDYNPSIIEKKYINRWLKNSINSTIDFKKEPYSIVMPPPNVTGTLTIGHVLNNTIQDILIRRARQEGKECLWIPGTDHAGIATQVRLEEFLYKKNKVKKEELGRDKFLEKAKLWRDEHSKVILKQLKRLGVSCQWDKYIHTLDDDYSKSVLTAFIKLYNRGYIYKGKRIVNWCPKSLTALSDEEVISKKEISSLYYIKYEFVDHPGKFIEIATTRPETIMGDVALAVNPLDLRYKDFIGKFVWRPLDKKRIPIIADHRVILDFGTGVLKITPSHDKLDFEIGKSWNLEGINVLNSDGTLNSASGVKYKGLDRFIARKVIVDDLDKLGCLVKVKNHENNIGYSERSKVQIEFRISEQWFLRYPKIQESKRVIEKKWINFWPERWEKNYFHWLNNIQDWCISRQIWWGHRIPVWYKKGFSRTDKKNWHVSIVPPLDKENWEQDDDVLDTWASSWIWPFATLGWPNEKEIKNRNLNYFYPTSTIVTGPDIIFFWIARMIIAAMEFMGDHKDSLDDNEIQKRLPFKNVYFTGIVRDSNGLKMSKSIGNSPDPVNLIDKYGADGLRLGIISMSPQGQDVIFNEEKIIQGRNFCNKLWNACIFRQVKGKIYDNKNLEAIIDRINVNYLNDNDHAILHNLCQLIEKVSDLLKKFLFSIALNLIYIFFWKNYCDWYLEINKINFSSNDNFLAIQDLILRELLLILHPFIPFITEELWENLKYNQDYSIQKSLIKNSLNLKAILNQKNIFLNENAFKEINLVKSFVTNIRSIKAEYKVATKNNIIIYIKPKGYKEKEIINKNLGIFKYLIGALKILNTEDVKHMPTFLTILGTIYLDLSMVLQKIQIKEEKLVLEKNRLENLILESEKILNNENFIKKAPVDIIEKFKNQLVKNKDKKNELERLINIINK